MLAYNIEKHGNVVYLSCSDNREIGTNIWLDLITYLLEPTDMAVVYNLDKFVDAILSILPPKTARELRDKGRAFLPYHEKLYYQVGRVFAITYAGREVNFYGLSRYTDKEITDVVELAKFGQKVIEAYQYFGITPTKLTSPVAVYGEILDGIDFPRACDLPESAYELVSKSAEIMWREWREVYKLGHWKANKITDYDLVAGYPSLIAKLPDIRHATYFTANTIPFEDYGNCWGVVSGKLTIKKDYSPFAIGEYPDMITTDQLWLLKRWGIGDIEVENGWFLKLPPKYALPFKKTMETLYKARENGDELVSRIAKGISVGIGGKFAQRYDDGKLGDNFNSIYALMITSRCGVKVCDFIYRNNLQDKVVSVLVDGVLVEGERLELKGEGMGAWRANPPSPFLVLSLLYQWGNDKRPASMTYDEIMRLIRYNPNNSVYGDIDFNLLDYTRHFPELPKTGGQLLTMKYPSLSTSDYESIQRGLTDAALGRVSRIDPT